MSKIPMKNAIAELDGDEMTRILWKVIKDKLLEPFVDLKTEYFDLGLKARDDSDDAITYASAEAIKRLGVGVKCATITSNQDRVKEYNLKGLTPSPNGIIRAELDGTVFRTPILLKNVPSTVSCWKKPLVLGRHAYGDVYKNCEMAVPGPGKAELVFTGADGKEIRKTIMEMKGSGILQGIHNLDSSIESFARACFIYGLAENIDVWFATKDTISKTYDGRFKEIFKKIFDEEFKDKFAKAGIEYFYTLIDDAVARVMRDEGGFLWACKNYDGDVMSDMVASASGSLAMMTSVLVSPDGVFEYEAAHGTVQRHYYRYLKGEKTSTNPVALIFAWTGALAKRAELDGTPELGDFAKRLEKETLGLIEDGSMTGDLARMANPAAKEVLDSWQFIDRIADRMR
ncbi:MAG TPA: NADP-dependent isocitrate dehydrogenase [Treponemataceae bacterium]|jgi:isocitrate dehydrogenase|nr:MAG: Isocitrate dehydrogenase (NADP) [Spirochaetes bacterium ADurb.Bin215]HOF85897.1 NADP-dependent isocitrate dehydrogenase [Treponemataceae bacterium]HOS36188.1 NADP-dependent isocitrate dehydrogenase [Treponemataceae bacterium]HOU37644.1 NADP-dependent isocitrate dehydrogenase [Treponemataceae bacterium]HPA09298.1 NADP-dependent isocitrate dehydrogenase [Treponemataceae bacterium]